MTLWDQLTDAQREDLVLEMVAAVMAHDVPRHLQDGLIRYFSDGILPGSFLQAVLVNDLRQACQRADPIARPRLFNVAACLIEHAPPGSWGSRAAVLAWTTTPDRLEI